MPRGRSRMRIHAYKTKRVIRRSMYEHVQGLTVRFVEPKDLPTGCCHLMGGENGGVPYTCTKKMSHVALTVEWRYVPESKARVPIVKMIGYCRAHRPKRTEEALVALPNDIVRAVNGTSNIKAKIARMENAMYVKVASPGSSRLHSALRAPFKTVTPEANWSEDVAVLCGKELKEAVLVSQAELREEEWHECRDCAEIRTSVIDEQGEDV